MAVLTLVLQSWLNLYIHSLIKHRVIVESCRKHFAVKHFAQLDDLLSSLILLVKTSVSVHWRLVDSHLASGQ